MSMVVIQPYILVSKLKRTKTKFLRCTGFLNSIKTHKARFIADRSNAMLLLWIIFIIYVSCLSLLFCLVCSLQPCDYLLGKGRPIGSLVYYVSLCLIPFSYCVKGQVWYLILTVTAALHVA